MPRAPAAASVTEHIDFAEIVDREMDQPFAWLITRLDDASERLRGSYVIHDLPATGSQPLDFGSLGTSLTEEANRRVEQVQGAINVNARRIDDNTSLTTNENTSGVLDDETYDLFSQGSRPPQFRYAQGIARRLPPSRFRSAYRPAREIPLSCRDACRCPHYLFENNPRRFQHETGMLNEYHLEARYRNRRQALGEAGLFSTTSSLGLVEMRQARAMTGLDTSEYDVEIARRVLMDPQAFGRLGVAMRREGWVNEVVMESENYVLR
ncbi:hypothetical protein N0V90_009476 [Kalmusia sp. IMI 367209]|nr:hypothetical protein N0V90_009476 [Kalmusia sp. IMI 367209]